MSVEENIKAVFTDTPGALRRQGEGLFIRTPLYKSKRRHTPVYINRALFKKLFSCTTEPTWEDMSSLLEKFFSSTVEKENSTGEETGVAYVDRQADPLDLSLSGNLGSGRAYYVGGMFNIKGEKTPLAKSALKKFSDGLLEMERCIWETLVANALQGSITTGLSNVLAVMDMNELCEVGWREEPVKRGKIIRIDLDGELDRVTHLFYLKNPLKKEAWHACATAYGRLEGDKFIERIIHGTWSPGNISPQGHLIDFDTVCAVKGRSPQFSSTRWYHENYFGSEFLGQLKVIEAMTADPHLNACHASFHELKDEMLSSMQEQIARRFVFLMGFKGHEEIYTQFKPEIDDIAALWRELARKGYKKHEEFSAKNPLSAALHLFDFSAFFRIYPLQKRLGLFAPQAAVSMMCETSAWEDPYQTLDDASFSDIEQKHLKDVYAALGEHFVTTTSAHQLLQFAALSFVKKYDRLHEKILKATSANMQEVEARAYVLNEDRFYMFPAYTASYQIAENSGQTDSAVLDKIIEALILANRRTIADRHPVYMADIRLYKEGYLYTLLDGKGGHRLGFSFFDKNRKSAPSSVSVDRYKLKLSSGNNPISMVSGKIDNLKLCQKFYREKSLTMIKVVALYSSGAESLEDLLNRKE